MRACARTTECPHMMGHLRAHACVSDAVLIVVCDIMCIYAWGIPFCQVHGLVCNP